MLADQDDNRVLEAAVTARADVIVTGDDDILALGLGAVGANSLVLTSAALQMAGTENPPGN